MSFPQGTPDKFWVVNTYPPQPAQAATVATSMAQTAASSTKDGIYPYLALSTAYHGTGLRNFAGTIKYAQPPVDILAVDLKDKKWSRYQGDLSVRSLGDWMGRTVDGTAGEQETLSEEAHLEWKKIADNGTFRKL